MGFIYTPIPPAIPYHRSKSKIRVLVCGARSGKSQAVFAEAASRAVLQPDIWQRDIDNRQNYIILIGEPVYRMVKKIAWRHIMRNLPNNRIHNFSISDATIYVRGVFGLTEIIFFSYESGSEKIEGLSSVYQAYLDEFYQADEEIYQEVITRLAERNGSLSLSGTPKNRAWITNLLNKASEIGLVFFTWKTADNPYFPKSTLEKLRKLLPTKIFKRNFEAALDCFVGQIYEDFNEKIHVQDFGYNPDDYYCLKAGQDWGYTHYGVFVLVGIRFDGGLDILDEIAEKQLIISNPCRETDDSDCWAYRVTQLIKQYESEKDGKKYSLDMCYCGVDEPASISVYRRSNIPVRGADNSVKDGILFVMTALKVDQNGRSRIRIRPRCKKTIEEFKTYKWQDAKTGEQREQPAKENDDAMDALRYCLFSSRREITDIHEELRYIKEDRDLSYPQANDF